MEEILTDRTEHHLYFRCFCSGPTTGRATDRGCVVMSRLDLRATVCIYRDGSLIFRVSQSWNHVIACFFKEHLFPGFLVRSLCFNSIYPFKCYFYITFTYLFICYLFIIPIY
jgi:hypothetical protein